MLAVKLNSGQSRLKEMRITIGSSRVFAPSMPEADKSPR